LGWITEVPNDRSSSLGRIKERRHTTKLE
jgi:hypothetical protein